MFKKTPSLWFVQVPMLHPSFTSEYLSHATYPLKKVKAMPPWRHPSLFQSCGLGSESQIWHLGSATLDWWTTKNDFARKSAKQPGHSNTKQNLYTCISQTEKSTSSWTIWKHLESDICFVMFWLLQKAFNKRKSVCIAIVAGRFRLGTVDRDILKVQVQIHDATVICVRASHESSSSQQPTGRQPNPPRPSKRMCVVWLLWRLIIKSMHSGPKAGSFIPKRSMANWQLLEVFCVTNSKHGQVSILLKYSPSRLEDNRTQIYSRH